MECPVDHWVHHRVGHAEEEYPEHGSGVDLLHRDECEDDEEDPVGRPTHDEGNHDDRRHHEGLHLRFPEELTSHGTSREHLRVVIGFCSDGQ